MRIAVLNLDHCKPRDCNYLCQRVCPKVRTGDEAIVIDEETKKPIISEAICSGCGICVKKCPFEAITIINLPEETGEPVHQYGSNGFRLYNLPTQRKGVIGVIGANGIGKTTLIKILSGGLIPNLGRLFDRDSVGDRDSAGGWDDIIERFKGKEIQDYLQKLAANEIKAVYKPQYVNPRDLKGNVYE